MNAARGFVRGAVALVAGWAGPALAAAEPITFQQIRVGVAVVSLPTDWKRHGPETPLWLHLHGAPAVVERNFATIGAPGVLVNVTLPGLSQVYADHFREPQVLADLLRDVEELLRRDAASPNLRLGRLTVSSFSAGFGGVRALLRQPAAFDRIDALVMADSIYCGYVGESAARRVDPGLMAGFLQFARRASEGTKRLIVSHSRQATDGYASTTETADYLIRELGGERRDVAAAARDEWPGGLRLLSRFARGQFEVLGFEGEAPEDHLRHLREIGVFLQRARAGP